MAPVTRAISIRQPFVEQILVGTKKYEYRSQPTRIRERVWLYAGLRPADAEEEWERLGKRPGDLPTGVIVGTVEIFDCLLDADEDVYAYALRKPERLRNFLRPTNQPQPKFWIPQF